MSFEQYSEMLKIIAATIIFLIPFAILATVVFVILRWLVRKTGGNSKKKDHKSKVKEQKTYQEPPVKRSANGYQEKKFMTVEEIHAYEKLKQFASYNFMHVFPKVKLLTFVELQNGPHLPYLKEKLADKHVDFVVLDQAMRVKSVIELDGCNPEWKGPDELKDRVLKELGYKVIHAKYITQETLKQI